MKVYLDNAATTPIAPEVIDFISENSLVNLLTKGISVESPLLVVIKFNRI